MHDQVALVCHAFSAYPDHTEPTTIALDHGATKGSETIFTCPSVCISTFGGGCMHLRMHAVWFLLAIEMTDTPP